jgi:hypothetical protein
MSQFPLIERFLQEIERHPEDFVEWLEMQPEYTPLRKLAASNKGSNLPKPRREKLLDIIKRLLWVDPDTLHGSAHVDTTLTNDAKSTATIVSTATLINILTTYPFLQFSFAGMGLISTGLTAVTGVLLLVVSNEVGVAVVSRTARDRPGAKVALWGFTALNLILSLTAGPGTELLLNQSMLAEERAQELIEERVLAEFSLQRENALRQKEDASRLQAECDAVVEKLEALPLDDPNRDLLYNRAYGTWAERDRNWTQVNESLLPICRRADRARNEVAQLEQQIDTNFEALNAQINQLGPLTFLKETRGEIYSAHFDAQGNVRSGLELSRVAHESFWSRLITGQWASLGFAVFFFVISLTTSGIAAFKLATYAKRKDVALSYDDSLYQIREEMFRAIERGLRNRR